MKTEKIYEPDSGYIALIAILFFIAGAVFAGMNTWILFSVILIVISIFALPGLITVQPNKACVLTLLVNIKEPSKTMVSFG